MEHGLGTLTSFLGTHDFCFLCAGPGCWPADDVFNLLVGVRGLLEKGLVGPDGTEVGASWAEPGVLVVVVVVGGRRRRRNAEDGGAVWADCVFFVLEGGRGKGKRRTEEHFFLGFAFRWMDCGSLVVGWSCVVEGKKLWLVR